jgi:hypothetical protein
MIKITLVSMVYLLFPSWDVVIKLIESIKGQCSSQEMPLVKSPLVTHSSIDLYNSKERLTQMILV